jgi:hypothetical protein
MAWLLGGLSIRRAIVGHDVIIGPELIAGFEFELSGECGRLSLSSPQLQAMREDLASG